MQRSADFLPGDKLQIKFSKAKSGFYLMTKDGQSDTIFKFLDVQQRVNRVRSNPTIQVAHSTVLSKGGKGNYITNVEMNSFTFLVFRNPCPLIMPFSDIFRKAYYSQ